MPSASAMTHGLKALGGTMLGGIAVLVLGGCALTWLLVTPKEQKRNGLRIQ